MPETHRSELAPVTRHSVPASGSYGQRHAGETTKCLGKICLDHCLTNRRGKNCLVKADNLLEKQMACSTSPTWTAASSGSTVCSGGSTIASACASSTGCWSSASSDPREGMEFVSQAGAGLGTLSRFSRDDLPDAVMLPFSSIRGREVYG